MFVLFLLFLCLLWTVQMYLQTYETKYSTGTSNISRNSQPKDTTGQNNNSKSSIGSKLYTSLNILLKFAPECLFESL